MDGQTEPWVGCLTAEIKTIEYTDWYWGDPACKTRCRDKITHRKFAVTPPLPEKAGDERYIVRTESGEDVECYSDGEYLVELNSVVEKETKYIMTFVDRLKALFLKRE